MSKFKFITALLFIVTLTPLITLAQVKPITGTITDGKGHPIFGASIIILGTTQGTVTDETGKFKLFAPDKGTLVVTSTGYKSQLIKLTGSSELKIDMLEDIGRLDEVVVTGLSTTIKRRNLANSVTTINATQLNGVAPSQTFDQALSGKIPGATINANTGAPGGGQSVKLRGVTSVYGNTQPLYVIDGVFVDNTSTSAGLNFVTLAQSGGALTSNQDNPSGRISDINAEDIENVEILKGASAAAIYGSRASAGVIIITTKKGKAGKTHITFSQDLGFIKVSRLLGVRQFTAQTAAGLSSDSLTGVKYALEFDSAKASWKTI